MLVYSSGTLTFCNSGRQEWVDDLHNRRSELKSAEIQSIYEQDLKDLKFWPLLLVRFLEFVAELLTID